MDLTKILDIIKSTFLWLYDCLLPIHLSVKYLFEKQFLRHCIYVAKPTTARSRSFNSKKNLLNLEKFSNGGFAIFVKHRNFFNFSQNSHFGKISFQTLAFAIALFRYYPQLKTVGDDRDKDCLKHRKFYFLLTATVLRLLVDAKLASQHLLLINELPIFRLVFNHM